MSNLVDISFKCWECGRLHLITVSPAVIGNLHTWQADAKRLLDDDTLVWRTLEVGWDEYPSRWCALDESGEAAVSANTDNGNETRD